MTDGTWSYTWQHGRQLASMSKAEETWSFTYNADGLRTQRRNAETVYSYVYDGSVLSAMYKDSDSLYFTYDALGMPLTVTYNGAVYYYSINVQGDIIALTDTAGNTVVQYTYDAWGAPLSVTGSLANTLGTVNPLRYRGYVYDQEIGLYYLQSRYYNPYIGRFINADAYAATGQGLLGNNMFTYCCNNPVNMFDSAGTSSEWFDNFWEDVISLIDAAIDSNDLLLAEHHKRGTTNPSNREKHENGQSRKQKDNGGEKKNQHKGWKPNPNKRNNILFDGLLAAGSVITLVFVVADDFTGVGVANDGAAIPLITNIVNFFKNLFS